MKKNFLKWMPMFIMALAAITFASCGDDKNDNGNGGGSGSGGNISEAQLIGFWEGPVHMKGKVYQDGHYINIDTDWQPTGQVDIRADHTYTEYEYDTDKRIWEENESGTWQLNGNMLTNKYINKSGKEHSVSVKIISATGNEFVMLMNDEDMKDIQDESELYATYRKINK